jgi:hypothetical protein
MKVKIEVLAEDSDDQAHANEELDQILRLVAGNPNAPHEILDAMSRETSPAVLKEVAQNPHTDLTTLDELINNPSAEVRAALTGHPEVISFAWKLVADKSPFVRYRLACTDGLPEHVYEALLNDRNRKVRQRAAEMLHSLKRSENVILWLTGFVRGREAS